MTINELSHFIATRRQDLIDIFGKRCEDTIQNICLVLLEKPDLLEGKQDEQQLYEELFWHLDRKYNGQKARRAVTQRA